MAAMVLPALIGGLASGAVSSIIGGKKETPAAVEEGPKVMPLADDQAVAAAKKRSLAMQMQRGGRASTMLTADTETLGN